METEASDFLNIGSGAISLRRMTISDLDDLMVWSTDSEVARFCKWEPYQSKEEGIQFINSYVLPHPWFRAICIGGRSIRCISMSLNRSQETQCRSEIGYLLGSQYWGRGITTEAVKMAVSAVFRDLKCVERVEAVVDVENVRSQRVLEKAGFTWEGVLRKYFRLKGRTRDMVMFSFLSTDPVHEFAK